MSNVLINCEPFEQVNLTDFFKEDEGAQQLQSEMSCALALYLEVD